MSRSILAVSVLLALVLVSAGGVAYANTTAGVADADATTTDSGFAQAQPSRGNATVSVSATATASAPPDRAVVRLAVVATAPDAETARREVAENVSTTRAALRDLGIADDRVRTTYFDISVVQEPGPNDETVTRYRAAHGLEIEVDPGQAGTVVDAAVGNGTNQVESVTFTLTDRTRRQLRRQALRQAMTNARADADVIADTGGVTITGVKSASTADEVVPFESRGVVGGGAPTTVEPGPVTVSATVSVTYRAG
ncbi:MAG: SIMPL domain-containing protein [Haloarculaceae archaeon]